MSHEMTKQSCGEPPQCPHCGSYYMQIMDPNYKAPEVKMSYYCPPSNLIPIFVNVKKLREDAKLPEKKTIGAAAYDLCSVEDVWLKPGEIRPISTGLSMEIQFGFKGEVYSRSGMACKGIIVANQPGKIDSDYRGEIKVILINLGQTSFEIKKGDRIAQFEINPVVNVCFMANNTLSKTERGEGGFGSTGVK